MHALNSWFILCGPVVDLKCMYPLPIGPSLLLLPVSVLRELQVVENFCDHAKFTLEVDRGKTENTLYRLQLWNSCGDFSSFRMIHFLFPLVH